MRIQSPLSPKAYLTAMRREMEGHFDLGRDRFTGFFLGPCFYVTYHSGYEWDRRYSNPKNAAMGYVKETEDGCEVWFWRFRGALCPLVFFPLLLTMIVLCVFLYGKDSVLLAMISTVIVAPVETLFESFTARSEEGKWTLLSFLKDPSDPYANYNNRIY